MVSEVPSREENVKFLAEAEQARAGAEFARAEAGKAAAETRKALAEAEVAEIDLAKRRHEESKRLAGDEHFHVYRFQTAVEAGSAKACMDQLATWHRLDPGCPIEIVFNSPGGDVVNGLALFDYIQELRRAGHRVTTKALGMAASMAGILLQAGDVRVMSAESWLLIHEASFGVSGSFGDVEDRVKWIERIQDRILDIFAARSKLSKSQIRRRWHRKDWWLSSDEALKLGFIDEVS